MKFVGQDKEYSTISEAITSSSGNGEFIVVSSGTYNEQVTINKYVNLRADTVNFEDPDVIISSYIPQFYDTFEDGNLDGWSFSGDADWTTSASGNGRLSDFSAKSGTIADSQSTCMYRTIDTVVDAIVSFYGKISSEVNCDWLKFYIDDVEQVGKISGTVDWAKILFLLPAGSHVLKWCYSKDSSASAGSDCCWVDDIIIDKFSLFDESTFEDGTLDGFSFSGNLDWVVTASGNGYGSAFAAKSGDITHNQLTCMHKIITTSEDGLISFYGKISSEVNCDWLKFYIDDVEQVGKISGTVDWVNKMYILPAGDHDLKWCYSKDGSVDTGSDCCWVDNVRLSTAANKTIKVMYSPEVSEDINIEGFGISKSDYNSYAPVYFHETNNKLGVYINKCHISGAIDADGAVNLTNMLLNKFFIKNGYINSNGFEHVSNASWDNVNEKGITYTQLDTNYLYTSCVGNLDLLNVVTTPTFSYGPTYGQYYADVSSMTCEGVVKDSTDINLADVGVNLYRRSDGSLVGRTVTNSSGVFSIEAVYAEDHFIVALNPDNDFNALIFDYISPIESGS